MAAALDPNAGAVLGTPWVLGVDALGEGVDDMTMAQETLDDREEPLYVADEDEFQPSAGSVPQFQPLEPLTINTDFNNYLLSVESHPDGFRAQPILYPVDIPQDEFPWAAANTLAFRPNILADMPTIDDLKTWCGVGNPMGAGGGSFSSVTKFMKKEAPEGSIPFFVVRLSTELSKAFEEDRKIAGVEDDDTSEDEDEDEEDDDHEEAIAERNKLLRNAKITTDFWVIVNRYNLSPDVYFIGWAKDQSGVPRFYIICKNYKYNLHEYLEYLDSRAYAPDVLDKVAQVKQEISRQLVYLVTQMVANIGLSFCDIKPMNIVINASVTAPDPQNVEVKFIDFDKGGVEMLGDTAVLRGRAPRRLNTEASIFLQLVLLANHMLNSRFTSHHVYENILAPWIRQTYDSKTPAQKEKLIDDITEIFITEPCFVLHVESYFGWLCMEDEKEIKVNERHTWKDRRGYKYTGVVVDIVSGGFVMRGDRTGAQEWVPKEDITSKWQSARYFEPRTSRRTAPGGWKDCLGYLVRRSTLSEVHHPSPGTDVASVELARLYKNFREAQRSQDIAGITAGVATLGQHDPRAAAEGPVDMDDMEGGQRTRIGSIKRKKKTKRRKHKKHKGGTKRRRIRRKRRSKHRKRSIN